MTEEDRVVRVVRAAHIHAGDRVVAAAARREDLDAFEFALCVLPLASLGQMEAV